MTQHSHVVVCIDHAEAKIFDFSKDDGTENRVLPKSAQGHIHHKAGSPEGGHAHDSKPYFEAVAAHLQPFQEILIVGHGTARTDFAHFVRDHVPALASRIKGVEAVDHPTDGEVVALARKFFKNAKLAPPREMQ